MVDVEATTTGSLAVRLVTRRVSISQGHGTKTATPYNLNSKGTLQLDQCVVVRSYVNYVVNFPQCDRTFDQD